MKTVLLVVLVAIAVAGVSWWNMRLPAPSPMPATEQTGKANTQEDTKAVSEHTEVKGGGSSILKLSGQGLTQAPSSTFTKTYITELDLSHNALTGALQAEVRHLQALRVLDLSDNQFTGVPAEIGQLSNLEVLDLSNNQLTGLPHELANLRNLKTLDLRGNNPSEFDLKIIREGLTGATILVD